MGRIWRQGSGQRVDSDCRIRQGCGGSVPTPKGFASRTLRGRTQRCVWGSFATGEHVCISGCVSAPYSCADISNEIPTAVRAALAEIFREGVRREKLRATTLRKKRWRPEETRG